jgi:hypothetical protein
MEGKILVSLGRHDPIEEILPYIEKIAERGMTVTFLIPYPVKLWPWFRDHWITTESAREASVAGKRILDKYSWQSQKTLADQRISLARAVLRHRQVEVVVDICTASMRRAIKNHALDKEVRLVLLRAGRSHPLFNLL